MLSYHPCDMVVPYYSSSEHASYICTISLVVRFCLLAFFVTDKCEYSLVGPACGLVWGVCGMISSFKRSEYPSLWIFDDPSLFVVVIYTWYIQNLNSEPFWGFWLFSPSLSYHELLHPSAELFLRRTCQIPILR